MSSRVPFSFEDQNDLAGYLATLPAKSRSTPKTHAEVAKRFPRHTSQAWMDYYRKSGHEVIDRKILKIETQRRQQKDAAKAAKREAAAGGSGGAGEGGGRERESSSREESRAKSDKASGSGKKGAGVDNVGSVVQPAPAKRKRKPPPPVPARVEENEDDELDELDEVDQLHGSADRSKTILVSGTHSQSPPRDSPVDPSPPTPNPTPPPAHPRTQNAAAPTTSRLPTTPTHSRSLPPPVDPAKSLPSPWLKANPASDAMSRTTSLMTDTSLSDDDRRMERQLLGLRRKVPPATVNVDPGDEDEDEDPFSFFPTPTEAELAGIEGYENALPVFQTSLKESQEKRARERQAAVEREAARKERERSEAVEEQERLAAEEEARVKKMERDSKMRMEADAEARRVELRNAEEERRDEEERKERRRERRENLERERVVEVERARKAEAERLERERTALVVHPPRKRPRASDAAVSARATAVASSGSTSRIPPVTQIKDTYSDDDESTKRRRIDPPVSVAVAAPAAPRSLRDELNDLRKRYGVKLKQLKDLLYACNVPSDLSGFIEVVEYYSRPAGEDGDDDEAVRERVNRLVWLYDEDLTVWRGNKEELRELQRHKDLSVRRRRATLVDFGAVSAETVPNRWPPV